MKKNRCYLFLKGNKSPQSEIIITHRSVPEPREWGEFRSANLWVEGDHWTIKGLRLEYGIGSSVRIWNGENIRIEDCSFSGATYGVWTSKSLKPAKNLVIDRCLYHNYPQYEWQISWLNWKEIYAYYSASTLSGTTDDPTTISQCVAVHCGDGIKLTSHKDSKEKIIARGNWIGNCTDDAIEFDGPGCNLLVHNNLITDSFVSLGLSPVSQGPVVIENNLFLHPLPGLEGALFKLLSPGKPKQTIRNTTVQNNLFWGNWLCWWNESPVENLLVKENSFFIKHHKEQKWHPSCIDLQNQYNIIDTDGVNPSLQTEVSRMMTDIKALDQYKIISTQLHSITQNPPGPSWWDWKKEPATQRMQSILKLIEMNL